MTNYAIRRLTLFVPTLLLVSVVIFVLMRVLPGDVAVLMLAGPDGDNTRFTEEDVRQLNEELGLDRPLPFQYADWLKGMVTLDFQESFRSNSPPTTELFKRLISVTLPLSILTMIVSITLAIPSGILQAVKRDKKIDYILRMLTITGVASPSFVTGVVLLMITIKAFGWIPPLEYRAPWEDPFTNFQQLILPALALGHTISAGLARMTRSSMLETLSQDYVRTARAKGLTRNRVVLGHAFRNAMLPVVTLTGLSVGALLSGSVVTETLFTLPGVGRAMIDAIINRDYPVVQFITLMFAFIYLVVNLVIDLTYGALDPRIRYD